MSAALKDEAYDGLLAKNAQDLKFDAVCGVHITRLLLDPIERLDLDERLLGQAFLAVLALGFDDLVEFPAAMGQASGVDEPLGARHRVIGRKMLCITFCGLCCAGIYVAALTIFPDAEHRWRELTQHNIARLLTFSSSLGGRHVQDTNPCQALTEVIW